jgi:hypothetical protein
LEPDAVARRGHRARGAALTIALGLSLALSPASQATAEPTEPAAPPPMALPQARIDHVDLSAWPRVRLLATVLDRRGQPVEPKRIAALEVLDGERAAAPPLVRFKNGQPLDGRADAKLWPGSKAGVSHGVVVVVVGHQHEALRLGSLGRRVKEATQSLLKRFGKTDRGQLIWAADRLRAWWGLKGRTGALSDLEETRAVCADARVEALSGGEITLGGGEEPPPPGTDLCGLRADLPDVGKLIDAVAFQGFFPRLFNLGLPFYHPKRYDCGPPREALDRFGPLHGANLAARAEELREQRERGEPIDFDTSALDEALRLLLRDGREPERLAIILISDGKDGYLRSAARCQEDPPARCRELTGKDRGACVDRHLELEAKRDQLAFRDEVVHWLGVARAAGIRVFAVGLGTLGTAWELERLRLLAERSGGTYREASSEADLAGAVAATAGEVFDPIVIDFEHQEPDTLEAAMSVRLKLTLDQPGGRGPTELRSEAAEAAVPALPTWRERARRGVEDALVAAQEALGYRVYVWVGTALLVVAGLILALLAFLVLRGLVRLLGRLFGRARG